tara:strand:+ start:1414 stop:2301 length:888 start_codon:yes stop_codon:yes gene_type:complete
VSHRRLIGPGAVVRVIAPSGPFDPEAFAAGLAFLRERYEVRHRPDVLDRRGYLAGSDERRLAELREALADPDALAVVAARGGYGATRLLEHLDAADLPPKVLVGFSDITALHALWQRGGRPSLHASMVAALGRADEVARSAWVLALEGGAALFTGLRCWSPGVATGPLVGGNLAVLAALVGTPYAPPLDGSLLLLEDVGERPYRLDRMLTSLRHAGWLDRVAGVVVGELTDCRAGPDGVEALAVLEEHLARLPVPVVHAIPVGHGPRNAPIWMGVRYRLDAGAGSLTPIGDSVRP